MVIGFSASLQTGQFTDTVEWGAAIKEATEMEQGAILGEQINDSHDLEPPIFISTPIHLTTRADYFSPGCLPKKTHKKTKRLAGKTCSRRRNEDNEVIMCVLVQVGGGRGFILTNIQHNTHSVLCMESIHKKNSVKEYKNLEFVAKSC